MKMKRLPAAAALGSLAVAAGMLVAAPAAHADLTTRCVGEGGAVTVPGDLVVPAGEVCWLDGTTVNGDMQVRRNADLVVFDGTLKGKVHVAKNAYLDTTDTMIAGTVSTANAFGAYLDGSNLKSAVNARNSGTDYSGFVYAVGSKVHGRIHAKVPGEVVVDSSHVWGKVVGNGTGYTDVYNSVLERALTVTGNAEGGVFCASEAYGDVSYSGNSFALQIGADGPVASCSGASYFGGNVDISDNTANINVSNTIIRGNLSGTGNDPAPTGENNRVRGTVSGQFAGLQPPADSAARRAAATHRDASLAGKATERRSEARAAADQAGDANL